MMTWIHSGGNLCYYMYVHTNDYNMRSMFFPKHNLWMVTWIHSACKLCYCVYAKIINLRSMFFLTMP